MIQINKDTRICISVAARPSNFGTTVHNVAYRALGLNFCYKAFQVSDIAGVITGVRALGIRGCSITMPFKEVVVQYLDSLDDTARAIGAVNTIVNNEGCLIGYNTDVNGAKVVLRTLEIRKDDQVLLIGAGGVAGAIKYALQQLGITNVLVSNRNGQKAEKLVKGTEFRTIPWSVRNEARVDVLINATSIGMKPGIDEMPVSESLLRGCRAVMDVIVTPMESRLIREAERLEKKVVRGYEMSLHQAASQFRLYTGARAPLDVMRAGIEALLKSTE